MMRHTFRPFILTLYFVAAAMLGPAAAYGAAPDTAPTGDINDDGSVDVLDVQCEVLLSVQFFLTGTPDADLCQSDADCTLAFSEGMHCRVGFSAFKVCVPGCVASSVSIDADDAPACSDPGADTDDCLGLVPKRVADLNCDDAINNVDLQFLVAVIMGKTGGPGTADHDGDGRLNFCDDDSDGDGDPDETDCAPLDSTIHAAAPEVCDELDNDCDGAVDEDDVCNPPGVECGGATYFLGIPDYDNYQIKLPIFDVETKSVYLGIGPSASGIGFNGARATAGGDRAVVWGTGSSTTTYGFVRVLDLTATPPVSVGGISGGNPCQALQTVEILEDQARCVVVSANSQLDGGLRFLDLADASVLGHFPRKQSQKGYKGAEIVPGGDHVVAWSEGSTTSAYGYYLALDVSGDEITQSGYHGLSGDTTAWIKDVVCSPDGNTCLGVASDLAVLSLPTLELEASFNPSHWAHKFEAAAISSDSTRAVAMQGTSTSSAYGGWHVLDLTQDPPVRIGQITGSADSNLYPTEVHVAADSLFAVGVANHLAIIDLTDGSLAGTIPGPSWQDDFIDGEMSPDGHYFIARTNTSYGGYFAVLDMTQNPPKKVGGTFGGSGADYAYVSGLLMTPDSTRALALGNKLLVIDLATASIIAEFPRPSSQDAFAGGAISCDGSAAMLYTPGSWSSAYGRYQLYDLTGDLPSLAATFGGSNKYQLYIQGVVAAP